MPLVTHQQIGPKACSASCIMCAAYELGTVHDKPNNTEAEAIYQKIWRGKDDEALMSKIIVECHGLKIDSTLIENTGLILSLLKSQGSKIEAQYDEYQKDVAGCKQQKPARAPAVTDLNGGERLIAVVLLKEGLTHSVLARKADDGVHVMNPDGGTDTLEAGFMEWICASTPSKRKIGNVEYFFTGIALQLTKQK